MHYGRVLHGSDEQKNNWTILQYHFFYAFNDWRLAANGMNHHEGDWEMIAVYLKNESPYAVLFSQHGAGNIEKWETVIKAIDSQEMPRHILLYMWRLDRTRIIAGLRVIRSPSMYKPGADATPPFFWTRWPDPLLVFITQPRSEGAPDRTKRDASTQGRIFSRKVRLIPCATKLIIMW